MLFDIEEPEVKSQNEDIAIGIDLGTTNSLAFYVRPLRKLAYNEKMLGAYGAKNQSVCSIHEDSSTGVTQQLTLEVEFTERPVNEDADILHIPLLRGDYVPSIVSYGKENVTIGEEIEGNQNIYSIKRLIGKGLYDIDEGHPFLDKQNSNDSIIKLQLQGRPLSPTEVSAEILKYIKTQAELHLKQEVKKAVITVPAYFDEAQRKATKDAAKIADLEVLRLINEPTAAALAYGLECKPDNGVYLVYDFGGGTFDVTVLTISGGVFKVIATCGDTNLGGDDIDLLLAKELNISIKEAKKLKEMLSANEVVEVGAKQVSRDDFRIIVKDIIDTTISLVKKALNDSKIEIDAVILVGGSSKSFYVRERLQEYFKDTPVLYDHNPETVVAIGAAIQANALVNGGNHLLIDVNPLSLGIEIAGGLVDHLIPRNSSIPLQVKREFTTQIDGQEAMAIHILQGERDLAQYCRSLARFDLTGIPSMKAGEARVEISFNLDTDGLLTVQAIEKFTGQIQTIEVIPSYGLNYDDITNIIVDSIENQETDSDKIKLIEAINDANSLINEIKRAIDIDKNLLNEVELAEIEKAIADVTKHFVARNADIILAKIKNLEQIVGPFIEKRITHHIYNDLKGKRIEEIR